MQNTQILTEREINDEVSKLEQLLGKPAKASSANISPPLKDNIPDTERCSQCGLSFPIEEFLTDDSRMNTKCKRCDPSVPQKKKKKTQPEPEPESGQTTHISDITKINAHEKLLKLPLTTPETWQTTPNAEKLAYQEKLSSSIVNLWEKVGNPMSWFVITGAKVLEDNIHYLERYDINIDLTGYHMEIYEQKEQLDKVLNEIYADNPEAVSKYFSSPFAKLAFILGAAALKTAHKNNKKKASSQESGSE